MSFQRYLFFCFYCEQNCLPSLVKKLEGEFLTSVTNAFMDTAILIKVYVARLQTMFQ